MLFVSYSIIDHFVKDLQVEGIDITLKTNSNGNGGVYWVIKLNGSNICRFYGKKNKIAGIGFKKEYCTKKEWLDFINDTNHSDTVDMGDGQFRGYKLHYDKHNFSYYIKWFKDHVKMACLYNEWN